MQNEQDFENLKLVLRENGFMPVRVDVNKQRSPIKTRKGSFNFKTFQAELLHNFSVQLTTLGLLNYMLTPNLDDFIQLISGLEEESSDLGDIEVPEEYKGLTLYLDNSSSGKELKFFLADGEHTVVPISGAAYMRSCGLSEEQGIHFAKHVTPFYDPKAPRGISPLELSSTIETAGFNTYSPPRWREHYPRKGAEAKCPLLIQKLIEHVIPISIEREFFYRWVRKSLRGRSPTFLVLCGLAGVGKNRLNILMSSLHGHVNRVAGKRTTLTGSFNWQLAESTLVWFDELSYNQQLENTMKELPNDQISIERKGVDATRSTKLFGSYIISNNKLRDNYFAFDARKFAALVLNVERLETGMPPSSISKLSARIDEANPEFDPAMLARFVHFLDSLPEDDDYLFPHMEYKGPMFWRIAYASMSRWQKVTIETLLTAPKKGSSGGVMGMAALEYEKGKGFLWSKVEKVMQKKKGKGGNDSLADYSTVKYFLDKFRDGSGKIIFQTKAIDGDAMGDFYVKVTNTEVKIISETDLEALKEEGDQVEARLREEAVRLKKEDERRLEQNSRRKPTKSGRSNQEVEDVRRSKKRNGEVSSTSQRRAKSRLRRREVSASH